MQFLSLQPDETLAVLLKKYDLHGGWPPSESIVRVCERADERRLLALLDEAGRTQRNLRSQVSPKYRYDEREADLSRCLELDGYRVTGNGLEQIEPTVEGQAVYEDDLSCEHHSAACRGRSVTLVGAGGWWPDPQLD